MSFSILEVFGRRFSKKPHPANNLGIVLIIGGMILILLFILTSLAITGVDGQFDDDDLTLGGMDLISGHTNYRFSGILALGFEFGVYFLLLRLQFLRSHIGEKRPAPMAGGRKLALMMYLFQTASARVCSAVFLILPPNPRTVILFLSSYEAAPHSLAPRKIPIS